MAFFSLPIQFINYGTISTFLFCTKSHPTPPPQKKKKKKKKKKQKKGKDFTANE